MTDLLYFLQGMPGWYYLAGLYVLTAFILDDRKGSYPFDSVLDMLWGAVVALVSGLGSLLLGTVWLLSLIFLWPVIVLWRNVQLNRARRKETSGRFRRLTGEEMTRQWLKIKGQRRYAWTWGRWHFMGRWLPDPEAELIGYLDPQHSVVSGHTFMLNLIVASLGISYLPKVPVSNSDQFHEDGYPKFQAPVDRVTPARLPKEDVPVYELRPVEEPRDP